jgi:CRP-like cAMP-binding protein
MVPLNMAWSYPLLRRIREGSDPKWAKHPAIDRALGAAMRTADPAGREHIVAALLHRGRPSGLRSLIMRYQQLAPADRSQLIDRIDSLHKPLREVVTHSESSAVLNALQLLVDAREGRLAYLITDRLRHGDPAVREYAATGLLELAHHTHEMSAKAIADLCRAVAGTVKQYRFHKHPAVLRAMLRLTPRPLAEAYEALQDHQHPATLAVAQMLTNAATAEARHALIPMLGVANLAEHARRGLRHAAEKGYFGEQLAGVEHLLDLPTIQRGMKKLEPPSDWGIDETTIRSWPIPSRQGYACWLAAGPWEAAAKVEGWLLLAADQDPSVRLAGLRSIGAFLEHQKAMGGGDPDAVGKAELAIHDARLDPAVEVSRLAAMMLCTQSTDAKSDPAHLRGPHPADPLANQWLQRRSSAVMLKNVWASWREMPEAVRGSALRALMKIDADALDQIETRLLGQPEERQQAIDMLASVGRTPHGYSDMHPEHHWDARHAHQPVGVLG